MENQKHPFLTYAHSISHHSAQRCLEHTLGFTIDDGSLESGVLLDQDGDEFYANPENDGIDFTTLEGFLNYAYKMGREDGIWETQHNIKSALGL